MYTLFCVCCAVKRVFCKFLLCRGEILLTCPGAENAVFRDVSHLFAFNLSLSTVRPLKPTFINSNLYFNFIIKHYPNQGWNHIIPSQFPQRGTDE